MNSSTNNVKYSLLMALGYLFFALCASCHTNTNITYSSKSSCLEQCLSTGHNFTDDFNCTFNSSTACWQVGKPADVNCSGADLIRKFTQTQMQRLKNNSYDLQFCCFSVNPFSPSSKRNTSTWLNSLEDVLNDASVTPCGQKAACSSGPCCSFNFNASCDSWWESLNETLTDIKSCFDYPISPTQDCSS